MEPVNNEKASLEQSVRALSQETQRKKFLRLSGKVTAPRRISLQQSNYKDGEDANNASSYARSQFNTGVGRGREALDIDSSLTIAPHEINDMILAMDKSDFMLKSMDSGNVTDGILKTNESLQEVNKKLFYDFLQCIQVHFHEPQIFSTIADFIQSCTDTLEIIRGMRAKVENTVISAEEVSLENERNTWRLIYCLYQNRTNTSKFHMQMEQDSIVGNNYISEKSIIENSYITDNCIREIQLIVDWLEKNAMDQASSYPTVECFTDRTVAWENTLHQLHNQNLGVAFSSTRSLVSSLDPDAPIRESKPLHDLDREDDARLEKRMFIEVRCGQLPKAQALAIHCGQPWRASCLLGWILYHDPNFNVPLSDTILPIEGNPNRDLWKLCAWELSQDKRIGQFYRAIYASLCGNLQQLLQISLSWQDALWAYMKTLLDIKVETELRAVMVKGYLEMPKEYWNNDMVLEDVFKELHASKDESIRMQANKPDHLIQKYLILNQIPNLMKEIDNMINLGTCDSQFLRFLAHLVLFLRQIGKNTKDKTEDKVLLAYVKVLIEIGDPILIAFYTATLPQEDQVLNYASYLEGVKDHEERKKCLIAAENANLNVEAITKMVVENIRQKNMETEPLEFNRDITNEDMEKINALDWLIFYQNQREEALWQTNALIRYFLTIEKTDAARKAFNKIPVDSIESVMAEYPPLDGTITNLTVCSNLSKKASCTIREYLCYKTYLDAQEGFAEWFSHFHHDKPTEPDELLPYATFTEKVAYDQKKAQYNTDLERWKLTMQHHTKQVKQLLFNVLLFPDGGWLIDTNNNEELTTPDVLREYQLEKLRQLCIPKITHLLHSVLSEMNDHAGCIQLADTLASEQYQLYKVFPKERLCKIFKKICESSLTLMNQKKDPWGYPK